MCVPKMFVGFWVRLLRRIGKEIVVVGVKIETKLKKSNPMKIFFQNY